MSGPIRKFIVPLSVYRVGVKVWACGNTHTTDVYSSAENTITPEIYSGCFGGHLLSHFSE